MYIQKIPSTYSDTFFCILFNEKNTENLLLILYIYIFYALRSRTKTIAIILLSG